MYTVPASLPLLSVDSLDSHLGFSDNFNDGAGAGIMSVARTGEVTETSYSFVFAN
ncbi:MAG: hypothetical protein ACQUHE_12700 [Bacteroidia bacterium]